MEGAYLYPDRKPLLSAEEQITHLESKGVKFNLMSKDDALSYLRENNNYFRLRSYRKGFGKVVGGANDGQYIGLDFAMLKDLSILDMRLRNIILPMTIDIEHFYKIKFLNAVEVHCEDGYQIVQDYLSQPSFPDSNLPRRSAVLEEINRSRNGVYTNSLIEHYPDDDYPIWAFIELIQFGRFNELYRFSAERFSDKVMKNDYYILQAVRGIRNACAHNNCFLNDLQPSDKGGPRYRANNIVSRAVSAAGVSRNTLRKKLSNDRIIQLTSVLYLHKQSASEGLHKHYAELLNEYLDRVEKTKSFYTKNQQISSFFDYLSILVRSWFPTEESTGTEIDGKTSD